MGLHEHVTDVQSVELKPQAGEIHITQSGNGIAGDPAAALKEVEEFLVSERNRDNVAKLDVARILRGTADSRCRTPYS
jgi:hypothetical protein